MDLSLLFARQLSLLLAFSKVHTLHEALCPVAYAPHKSDFCGAQKLLGGLGGARRECCLPDLSRR
jgi:hypothetical protein